MSGPHLSCRYAMTTESVIAFKPCQEMEPGNPRMHMYATNIHLRHAICIHTVPSTKEFDSNKMFVPHC